MKLLQQMVTDERLVRLSHSLSEGLNRVGDLAGGERRRKRNRAAFDRFHDTGLLNGQSLGILGQMPYGGYTMDYNGCEVIACCNALRLLGRNVALGDVAAYFERHGIFLGGLWGTHAAEIPRYFTRLGFKPETLYASAVRGSAQYDDALAKARAGVFSFWNDAKRLRSGVHTVALTATERGLTVYNLDCGDPKENTAYRSISDWMQHSRILPILLVTLP
ncbi:MAG: hypothetical protein IJ617_02600 [Oscillospiraceae bacterium]|nr:hypothetical protein [Oscillospiraceae bacterium]